MIKKIFGTGFMISTIVFLSNCVVSNNTTSATNGSTTTTTTCTSQPSPDATLTDSTSTSVSHKFGQDCMSCHSLGGSAVTAWTIAGSMADGNNSTNPAVAGSTITSVAQENLTLVVDTCGNFYTTATVTNLASSSPATPAKPSGMNISGWSNTAQDGSCNRSGCHTSGAGAQGYIY